MVPTVLGALAGLQDEVSKGKEVQEREGTPRRRALHEGPGNSKARGRGCSGRGGASGGWEARGPAGAARTGEGTAGRLAPADPSPPPPVQLRRQLEERFGESPFRDEEDVRALLPLCKRCRQGSAAAAASPAAHSAASEGTLQRLVPRPPREAHRPLPLLARVKQTFSCLPRCLSRKGGK